MAASSGQRLARASLLILTTLSLSTCGGGAAPREWTGSIEAVVKDGLPFGTEEKDLFLVGTGRHFHLRFTGGSPTDLRTGTEVTVNGRLRGSDLLVDNLTVTQSSPIRRARMARGTHTLAVVAVDFQDKAIECTNSQLNETVFGESNSANADYRETSAGALTFTGDVLGPVTISAKSTDPCDYSTWGNEAAAVLGASALSGYQHVFYVFANDSCSNTASGYGDLDCGASCTAWNLGYCQTAPQFAHELGHNLGMNHSKTPSDEYGDFSDFMGNFWRVGGHLLDLNGVHQTQLGWISSSATVGPGTYLLQALEENGSNTLKINKPDTQGFYLVSYRTPAGYDSNLPESFQNKVTVHLTDAENSTSTLLSILSAGESFSDPVNHLTLTLTGIDSDSAAAQVTVGE